MLDIPGLTVVQHLQRLGEWSRRTLGVVDAMLDRPELPEDEGQRWMALRRELATLTLVSELTTLPDGDLHELIPHILSDLRDMKALITDVEACLTAKIEPA